MNSSLFIARRFLSTIRKEKNIATMLIISSVSIMMSTLALALIMAIMNGFQQATSTIMQGIHSDITIEAPLQENGSRGFLHFEKINEILKKEFHSLIAHATPIAHHHAIIQAHTQSKSKKNRTVHDISHVVLIEGIVPESDSKTRSLMTMITKNMKKKESFFSENRVRIGKTLAQDLGLRKEAILKEQAHVDLLFAQAMNSKDDALHFEKITLLVDGTFTTGIDDFDQAVIFCSLETFTSLFPEIGIHQIGVKLKPGIDAMKAIGILKQRFNLDIMSWQELYPALLDAQKLEKSAMFIVLLLVASIASVTGIALLLMYLFHQQTTLAIFAAMGMGMRQLRIIFTVIATIITFFSTIAGLACAALASWLIETYQLIPLPDVYYVHHVPAHMDITTILLVLCLMNGVCLLTSWLTTSRIKKMNLALLLKQGGH